MNLIINGETRQFPDEMTVGSLLQQLELQPDRVVLELNRQILGTGEEQDRTLLDGDQLEIIQFVGGG